MPESTEQRVVIHKPGGYDALTLESFTPTPPAADEITIDVAACGVNYADCVIRMGLYKSAKELHGYPITPGFEVAGTVSHVGKQVSGFKLGDSVIGITLFGGYSSRVNLPAQQVFACPKGISLAAAAGIPTVFLTAWFGLHHLASLSARDTVLIHSGAGGVGLAAIQLVKQAGAKAVAVVGASHKVDTTKAYGADAVIDKSSCNLWDEAERISPSGYDIIMDPNGYTTLQASYNHLAPVGKVVIYGFHSMLPKAVGRPNYLKLVKDWLKTPRFNPLNMTAENKSVLAFNLSFLSSRPDLLLGGMNFILQSMSDKSLKPLPIKSFQLEQIAAAQQLLESAQTVGKVILTARA